MELIIYFALFHSKLTIIQRRRLLLIIEEQLNGVDHDNYCNSFPDYMVGGYLSLFSSFS
jgi:hypothetical protein